MYHLIVNFQENPAIGLYAFANNKFCLIRSGLSKNLLSKIEETLKVPVYEVSICESDLIGAYIAGNDNILLVPSIALESEIELLKKICDKHNVNLVVLEVIENALGNNLIIGNKKILLNSDFSKREVKKIEQKTKMQVEQIKIPEISAIGSICRFNSRGGICGKYKELFSEKLEIKFEEGTVLHGSIFVSIGVITNNFGCILSKENTGIEIAQIDEALGFVELG
ncbi:MAG: translation initiation factor IF-6 [Candidatus Woesearchaeota archaeon]